MERLLVIYHANCPDGFGAAVAACCDFLQGDDRLCDFVAASFDQSPPEVTERQVYILDFSYAHPVLKTMCSESPCTGTWPLSAALMVVRCRLSTVTTKSQRSFGRAGGSAPLCSRLSGSGTLCKWSLRSSAAGTYVAEIATRFGSDGHQHAAGFITNIPEGLRHISLQRTGQTE